MFIFEILVAVVMAAFIANGYRSGTIETLGRAVGAVVGFLVAHAYSGVLAYAIASFLPQNWANVVAFIVIFSFIDQLIGKLFALGESVLKILTRLPVLKQINQYLGALFGFLEGVVIIGGVSWLLAQSSGIEGVQILNQLRTVTFIDKIFETVILRIL